MPNFFDDILEADDADLEGKAPPSAKILDWLHGNASTTETTDMHHRLGFGPTEASQGDHVHDGKSSRHLFSNTAQSAVSGASTTAQLAAAITELQALMRRVGAS